jgi:hypothetical protein
MFQAVWTFFCVCLPSISGCEKGFLFVFKLFFCRFVSWNWKFTFSFLLDVIKNGKNNWSQWISTRKRNRKWLNYSPRIFFNHPRAKRGWKISRKTQTAEARRHGLNEYNFNDLNFRVGEENDNLSVTVGWVRVRLPPRVNRIGFWFMNFWSLFWAEGDFIVFLDDFCVWFAALAVIEGFEGLKNCN